MTLASGRKERETIDDRSISAMLTECHCDLWPHSSAPGNAGRPRDQRDTVPAMATETVRTLAEQRFALSGLLMPPLIGWPPADTHDSRMLSNSRKQSLLQSPACVSGTELNNVPLSEFAS